MSYELIAGMMFAGMLVLLATGQRIFGAVGFVAAASALFLWGEGAVEMPFNASFVLLNWYAIVTLPLFVYMGYMLSESGIANDLYRMFHVWAGPLRGGLAVGTVGLMVVVSCMNGLSVAGGGLGTVAIMSHPHLQAMAERAMREVAAVANADLAAHHSSANLDADAVVAQLFPATDALLDYKTSMVIDYLVGRELEVESILGEPARRAAALGVPAPTIEDLYALVHAADQRRRGLMAAARLE